MADGTAQAKLTALQERFIDLYLGADDGVSKFNASESAILAGYKKRQSGDENMSNPVIRARIDDLLTRSGLSRDETLSLVADDARRTNAEILALATSAAAKAGVPAGASAVSALVSARTTARTNLLRVHGALTDRLNVKHSGRVDHVHRIPKSIDALTEDELDKLEVIAARVAAEEVVSS